MPTLLRVPLRTLVTALLAVSLATTTSAQVHYHPGGSPWNQRASSGPDAVVDGWYYNLGITGMRVQLMPDAPKHLLVKHVFDDTPASSAVRVGDVITGAGGAAFLTEHQNGYGMDKFGPKGPILEFAIALEACQSSEGKGRLQLTLLRAGKEREVGIRVGKKYGAFGEQFPTSCKKSDTIREELCDYLLDQQRDNGSWGSPVHDLFAPLALLASGEKRYAAAVEKNARFHAANTGLTNDAQLVNWRYMAAGIVLSEYFLSTKEKWVIAELEEIYSFLLSSQYMDLAQVNPRVRESHPNAWPKNATDSHGGWGHNPGFEGYGPISMLTGQGALAFSLMARCGVEVDRARLDAAFDFLERGTGKNGYVWYEDQVAGNSNWADMGRTGAAGIANAMSPYGDKKYQERAEKHSTVIGRHPEVFPDTHGSPLMGMGFAALSAGLVEGSYRNLMDGNRWWFALAQCADGSFYYQPNRDNAGYGANSRVAASAVSAFILSIPLGSLQMTGAGEK